MAARTNRGETELAEGRAATRFILPRGPAIVAFDASGDEWPVKLRKPGDSSAEGFTSNNPASAVSPPSWGTRFPVIDASGFLPMNNR